MASQSIRGGKLQSQPRCVRGLHHQSHSISQLQAPHQWLGSQHSSAPACSSSAGALLSTSCSGVASFSSSTSSRAAASAAPAEEFSSSGAAQFAEGSGVVQFGARREAANKAQVAGVAAVPLTLKDRWKRWKAESYRLRSQLRAYGAAGLLAYGLLNTLYYSAAFLVIWLYIAKVPRGLGWSEVTKQFATVMSLTWAASQITKVPRAALALVFAPVADAVLLFMQARLRLGTRRNAFLFVVASCLALSAVVFGTTVWVWA